MIAEIIKILPLTVHEQLSAWGREFGFSAVGISGIDLSDCEAGLLAWLAKGFHGEMDYMARHGMRRARPAELLEGTVSVITARMDYLPRSRDDNWRVQEQERLNRPHEAVISTYARGRDYHKVMRSRLQSLSEKIALEWASLHPGQQLATRVFVDSAPVMEVELARQAQLGWRGKHTLLLNKDAGSMFFLGEIFVNHEWPSPMTHSVGGALAQARPTQGSCGSCSACIDICPTKAIVAPYQLDARRCISYLTIEHKGIIPIELRRAIGNRIYGCDDCQTACPWNKFAKQAVIPDFDVRDGMVDETLLALFAWSETEFLKRTEGSAIRRIGHERWQRNIAVALGNQLHATVDQDAKAVITTALMQRRPQATALVQAHIDWALASPERLV